MSLKINLLSVMSLVCLLGFAEPDNTVGEELGKFLKGQKSTWSKITWDVVAKPYGTVEVKNGILTLVSKGAMQTGIFGKSVVTGPDAGITIKITASGEGKLRVGFWSYDEAGKNIYPASDAEYIQLTPEKKEYVLNLVTSSKTGKILPSVYFEKTGGSARIYSCDFSIFKKTK